MGSGTNCLFWAALAVARLAPAQDGAAVEIPPVKSALQIEGQTVGFTAWGRISAAPSGTLHLAATVDLGEFQEHLTPVLAAQLNRSDRCGERLTVERAALAPAPPGGLLTVWVHFERYACAKAFGKEIVKRVVGGNATVEVDLTPSIAGDRIEMAAAVRKIDADGSLGEMLRSGSSGDSLRQRIAAAIESSIRKSADLKSTMPAAVAERAALETVRFADGGAGRLWLSIGAGVRLSPEELRAISSMAAR
jgi:hypothetical protein